MAATTIDRPSLRLATEGGRRVIRPARSCKPLRDREAEDMLVEMLRTFVDRLDPGGDFRLDVAILVATLEQRRARRAI